MALDNLRDFLDAIDAVGGDVFRRRPRLATRDWLTITASALLK